VGGLAFIAGVLFVLMGMGRWQEDNNPVWLSVSVIVAICTVVGGLKALFKRGK
jgi:UDP-N-acetylmuramyl pentapeptide phosphotransferase/UDP-N-acetylglucosamine-1-phosphate transferase